jgi:hypothetical protein
MQTNAVESKASPAHVTDEQRLATANKRWNNIVDNNWMDALQEQAELETLRYEVNYSGRGHYFND